MFRTTSKKISIRQLTKAVSKTPTYISDMEKGNNKPLERELLDRIITALQLEEFPDVRNKLYDLVAKEIPNERKIWAKVSQII